MKYIFLSFLFILSSCGGKVEKSWTVNDFSKARKFSLKSPNNKTVSNANIFLDGFISDTIYLSRIENDSSMIFTNKNLPNKISSDFYGGEFHFYLNPSKAKGELNITITINYY